MTQITVESISELVERLNSLPNNYVYRGHANALWPLQSSLERMLGNKGCLEAAKRFEDYSLQGFQSKFHLYDRENIRPKSKLAWLATMQHYGVPTRLLDFTESPYVALYFALEAYNPHCGCDFAVFAFDYTGVMEHSLANVAEQDSTFNETRLSVYGKQDEVFELVDSAGYEIAWVAEPTQFNARLDRQAGSFLLSINLGLGITDALRSPLYNGVDLLQFVIPQSQYGSAFALLRKMNITSKSLYGDLDGLARGIRMQMQAYSL
jgi:FRG domain